MQRLNLHLATLSFFNLAQMKTNCKKIANEDTKKIAKRSGLVRNSWFPRDFFRLAALKMEIQPPKSKSNLLQR